MNKVTAFTPLRYDLPPGQRVKWIGSLLKGRFTYQIVNDQGPKLVVYPKTADEVLEVETLVKMVLTHPSTGPTSSSKFKGGRTRVLFALLLLLSFLIAVAIVYAIRMLLLYFFG